MTIGQRIRATRRKAGMTQKELAQKLGIPFQGVSQWENGSRNPKPETIEKIADAIGVDYIDLIPKNLQGVYLVAYMLKRPKMTVEDENGDIIIQGAGRRIDLSKKHPEMVVPSDLAPDEAQRLMDERVQAADEASRAISASMKQLGQSMAKLNPDGWQEAVKRVEELTEIPRYQAQQAPQSLSTPSEGTNTNTTPPPTGTKGPQDGTKGAK